MKKLHLSFFFFILLTTCVFAQGPEEHFHDWRYASEDNAITAYCADDYLADDCDFQGIENAVRLEVDIYSEKTLQAIVSPENAANNLIWTSSDPSVATVSPEGRVTAQSIGTAQITAQASGGIVSNPVSVTVSPTYSVTFDSNGGSSVPSYIVYSGKKLTTPTDPELSGYHFGGWYKDTSCTDIWNFEAETVTADTTLYAKWQKLITVTFVSDQNSHCYALADSFTYDPYIPGNMLCMDWNDEGTPNRVYSSMNDNNVYFRTDSDWIKDGHVVSNYYAEYKTASGEWQEFTDSNVDQDISFRVVLTWSLE